MIKSTIRKSTYRAMYRLLDMVSPLEFDCGRLCGAACCRDDTDVSEVSVADTCEESPELGMELLPGEDKIHDRNDSWLTWSEDLAQDMDYPESWQGKVYFIKCGGPETCRREMRPIQCRTFPLAPHILDDGRLIMILNSSEELTYDCPLTDPELIVTLNRDYVRATYTVWKRLITDPLIRDLVEMDSSFRDTAAVVYDPEEIYESGSLIWLGEQYTGGII